MTSMKNKVFSSQNLQLARSQLGWSQQRLADELGVARNTINRMEMGHMVVERRTTLAVQWLLHVHAGVAKDSNALLQTGPVKSHPAEPEVVQGDSHTQVVLPLTEQASAEPVAPRTVERRSDPAADAWAIYEASISDRLGFVELKERFFRVAEEAQENGYHFTYLFFLQLLERLCSMTAAEGFIPVEWGNIRCLRAYVLDFYKSNPQWH